MAGTGQLLQGTFSECWESITTSFFLGSARGLFSSYKVSSLHPLHIITFSLCPQKNTQFYVAFMTMAFNFAFECLNNVFSYIFYFLIYLFPLFLFSAFHQYF
jgi:hypothetical protein